MVIIRWIAYVVGAECLIVLAQIPRGMGSMLTAALFLICFAVACWTHGAFRKAQS